MWVGRVSWNIVFVKTINDEADLDTWWLMFKTRTEGFSEGSPAPRLNHCVLVDNPHKGRGSLEELNE